MINHIFTFHMYLFTKVALARKYSSKTEVSKNPTSSVSSMMLLYLVIALMVVLLCNMAIPLIKFFFSVRVQIFERQHKMLKKLLIS